VGEGSNKTYQRRQSEKVIEERIDAFDYPINLE